jgi:hypothetical protein
MNKFHFVAANSDADDDENDLCNDKSSPDQAIDSPNCDHFAHRAIDNSALCKFTTTMPVFFTSKY